MQVYIHFSGDSEAEDVNTAACSVPLGSSLHEDSAVSRRDRANTTRQGTRNEDEDQRSTVHDQHDVSRRRRRQSSAARRQCTLSECFSRIVLIVLLTCRECRECEQLDRVTKSFIFTRPERKLQFRRLGCRRSTRRRRLTLFFFFSLFATEWSTDDPRMIQHGVDRSVVR